MKRKLNADATMDRIMRQTPATIRVVLQHGMLCVGCPIASFHTVFDAAREHDLDEDQLRHDLEAAPSVSYQFSASHSRRNNLRQRKSPGRPAIYKVDAVVNKRKELFQ